MKIKKPQISALITKEDDGWKIKLEANSPRAEKNLGRMINENNSPHRHNRSILVLWERESRESTDGSVKEIEFAISEGPDSDNFSEARMGLSLLNLRGLFLRK